MANKCGPKSVGKKTPAYRLAKPTTLIPGDVIQSTINGWRGRLRVTAVIPHPEVRPLVTVKTYDDESHREIWLTVRAASRLRVVLTNPGGKRA